MCFFGFFLIKEEKRRLCLLRVVATIIKYNLIFNYVADLAKATQRQMKSREQRQMIVK